MQHNWVGERVAVTDLSRVLRNLASQKDDISWGPNSVFHFPKQGGTGAIWSACAARLPKEKTHFGCAVEKIDSKARQLITNDGRVWDYDALVSTLPLTELLRLSGRSDFGDLPQKGLKYSSANIVGIGIKGKPPEHLKTKCWMYFPESDCPFYRVTVFSNYSPNNVPDSDNNWSVMTETSESAEKPVDHTTLVQQTIDGLRNTRLLNGDEIISTWSYRAKYGYPTPGLHRDAALAEILPGLEADNVYSRGRFGAWKYEVSNQDHSFMQGLEVIERIIHGRPEITLSDPNYANSQKHPFPFERWTN
jgi:protoporphyrinogen oxidase